MKTHELASWLEPVARYIEHWQARDRESGRRNARVPGATDQQIEHTLSAAAEHNLHVDPQIVEFFRFANGTSFAGLIFAGAGIPADDDFRRVDFIRYNSPESNPNLGDVTLYGSRSYETFRYVASVNRFQGVDESLDVIADFETFGELIAYAFNKQLTS